MQYRFLIITGVLSLFLSFSAQARINSPYALDNQSDSSDSLIPLDKIPDKYEQSHTSDNHSKTSNKYSFDSIFKNKSVDIFPVPVIESRPDEGQSYGLMPVLLLSDKETEAITVILAAIGQWNNIIKFSGATLAHIFPNANDNPDEVFEIYFEYAQRYYREVFLHYYNPRLGDKFFLDTNFVWLRTPFYRFYGYGADTDKSGESNYVSSNYFFNTTFGYYITPKLRINLTEQFRKSTLSSRAFTDVLDTLTQYGGLPGVVDSKNLLHKLSVTFDTRPNGVNSKRGTFVEGSYFFSVDGFLSDQTINGYGFEAIQLLPWFNERTITLLRFNLQDMYGTAIPFYHQSTLGGDKELRAFIPNRFTDTGKAIFTLEQRIRILSMKMFGIPVEFYADPFFELGTVFHHIDNLKFNNLQPVGGIGLRAFVPPNVVGRLDIAVGTEGYSVYTMLGYPF